MLLHEYDQIHEMETNIQNFIQIINKHIGQSLLGCVVTKIGYYLSKEAKLYTVFGIELSEPSTLKSKI
jgi:hypothetical protein